MADFTTYFGFEKPAYKTLRYDLGLNLDMDRLDDAFRGWANAVQPGSLSNYQDITLTDGVRWMDTGNNVCKIYIASAFQSIISCEQKTQADISGAVDLTTWGTSIGSTPKYVLEVKVGSETLYIPVFTSV